MRTKKDAEFDCDGNLFFVYIITTIQIYREGHKEID